MTAECVYMKDRNSVMFVRDKHMRISNFCG